MPRSTNIRPDWLGGLTSNAKVATTVKCLASVVRIETIRTVLATRGVHIHQLDVATAYVQADLIDEVCMEQPELFTRRGAEGKTCKLKK